MQIAIVLMLIDSGNYYNVARTLTDLKQNTIESLCLKLRVKPDCDDQVNVMVYRLMNPAILQQQVSKRLIKQKLKAKQDIGREIGRIVGVFNIDTYKYAPKPVARVWSIEGKHMTIAITIITNTMTIIIMTMIPTITITMSMTTIITVTTANYHHHNGQLSLWPPSPTITILQCLHYRVCFKPKSD